MKHIVQKYYQSELIFEDDHQRQFKVVFGYFDTEKEARQFNRLAILWWRQGKFYMHVCGQTGLALLDADDITYVNGEAIDDVANLYPEVLEEDIWHREKSFQHISNDVITRERKLDIETAYKELWRVIFNILDNIGEAIQYNGELAINGSALDSAFNIWETAGKLMKDDVFDSYLSHTERLADTYDLLQTIFKGLDSSEALRTVKNGQSLRYQICGQANRNSLVHSKYMFNR